MAARKTSQLPTRIWKFAARFLTREDEHLARDILYTSGRYYNRLVEIEQARVGRFREIRARYAPELAAADAAWMVLDDQIGQIYRDTRDARQRHFRQTDGEKVRLLAPEFQVRVDALKAEQKVVSEGAKQFRATFSALLEPGNTEKKLRSDRYCAGRGPRVKSVANAQALSEMLDEAAAWPQAWKEIARADDEAHQLGIKARAECKLATGTYLKVEEAFQRAKKDSSPRAPSFHRLQPTGLITIQFANKGTAYVNAVSSEKLHIRTAPHDPSKKGDQTRMMSVRMDQSVPRGENRAINATVKMHRLPPSDATVKWASWCVRRAGKRTLLELQLTLEHASFAEAKRPAGERGPEHIQIGWARTKTGTRVASWPGGDVIIPDSILRQHDHSISITSAADQMFVQAKRLIRKCMYSGPHHLNAWHRMLSDHARDVLRKACVGYAEFVFGADRAHTMWREWVASRKSLGLDLYAMPRELVRHRWANYTETAGSRFAFWCLLWAKKDAHLSQYAIDSARRFEHRRDAFFRAEAIRIATEFAEVTVDNYNIADLKKLAPITMPGETPRDRAQHQLHEAAPGRFREILKEVMGTRCTPHERSGDEKKPGGARSGGKKGGKSDSAEDGEVTTGDEKGTARGEVGNAAE